MVHNWCNKSIKSLTPDGSQQDECMVNGVYVVFRLPYRHVLPIGKQYLLPQKKMLKGLQTK